jgi:hypothetical protein
MRGAVPQRASNAMALGRQPTSSAAWIFEHDFVRAAHGSKSSTALALSRHLAKPMASLIEPAAYSQPLTAMCSGVFYFSYAAEPRWGWRCALPDSFAPVPAPLRRRARTHAPHKQPPSCSDKQVGRCGRRTMRARRAGPLNGVFFRSVSDMMMAHQRRAVLGPAAALVRGAKLCRDPARILWLQMAGAHAELLKGC